MAQSIKNLALGSKIKDSKGNKFVVIAKSHYGTNEVTLMAEKAEIQMKMSVQTVSNYTQTEVHYYLNNSYLKTLEEQLVQNIKITKLPIMDHISSNQVQGLISNTKVFILSMAELGDDWNENGYDGNPINYIVNNPKYYTKRCWTRTEPSSGWRDKYWTVDAQSFQSVLTTTSNYILPTFNVGTDLLVSDQVSNGYYSFVFNAPPVIQNIQNMTGNFGTATNIKYTAIDSDDTELTHYISFNNGASWQKINPARNSNTYTYSYVFNELGEYNTRIKVIDSANNEVTSNLFIISVSATNPTVNIVSVVDKVVTFKVGCKTHDISKVEILVNGTVKKTYESGFGFNLVYEVDRTTLNQGKNSMQIKATASSNLAGVKDLEINKTTYSLPPVGTKIEIGSDIYTITYATTNGSNQIYTLDKKLLSDVKNGDKIKVNQDAVKVYCSLSNLENSKDFKEMKLVKVKKLKGMFEGYVEEKFELEGEGRYSAIKLEAEIFNQNVPSDIRELQQYFDYLED